MKYIFDVDGTLSFDGVMIDARINSAIKELEAAGNEVIFASARPIRDLLPMIPGFTDHKLIGANGAMISIDKNIQVIAKIELDNFNYLKSLIEEFQLDYIVDGSWNYSSRITQSSPIEKMIDPKQLAQKVMVAEISNPIKIIFVNVENELQQQLLTDINEQTSLEAIGLAGEGTVDITASGINKHSTLERLKVEQYVAFGNDRNDFEMLKHAVRSVWVASKPGLKAHEKQADVICQPNPAAVAELIRNFI